MTDKNENIPSDDEQKYIDLSEKEEIDLYITAKKFDINFSIADSQDKDYPGSHEIFINILDGSNERYISLLRLNDGSFIINDGRYLKR